MKENLFNEKITVKWSIKWKLITLMTLLLISMVGILTYLQISSQKKMMEKELNKRIVLMKENLIERGKTFITNLSSHVENDIASFNFSGAMEAVKEGVSNNSEIKYAILMDTTGVTLIHTLKPNFDHSKLTKEDIKALNYQSLGVIEYKEKEDSVIEIVHPIRISTTPWGVLRLIYTLRHLDREIKNSEKQIRMEINQMMFHSVIASLIFIADCFIIVFILSSSFAKPLIQLTYFAKKLSTGDFSVSYDIDEIRSKDEVGLLAATFADMSKALKDSYEKLEEYSKTLEQMVEERTKALHKTLREVEEANKKIMESIQYAQMIQRSLLTNSDEVKAYIPNSFTIWMPRDVVGGDIIFSDFFKTNNNSWNMVGAVIDCTGHGVPGAFMTMIASSGLRRIIRDEGCHDPAMILKRLNVIVKTLLKQDTDQALSDDGLDAAICFIKPKENLIIFAGARLSLHYVHHGEVFVIKGDKESIGYKRSNLDFEFANHVVKIEKEMSFYMITDGFTDQLGGERRRRFGARRFRELIKEHYEKPFEEQKNILLREFYAHKGKNDVQDDVTVIGFSFR